ncbi:MAG TPA: hypothetical protein VNK95_13150, partial [Caldilineaceae bacterium]|nr:hypothetical protein [Caldilineaceae bacterium]
MLLRLRKGSTLITLSGDGATIAGCTYTPRTPDLSEQEATALLRSGGEVTALARRNVTESASVILVGSTATMLAQARALEALFAVEEAERRIAADKLYVEFRAEASGDIYRSEILAGRVEWPNQPLSPRLAGGAVELVVIWKRRYFWEDTALRTLPLSNGNGTNVATGLTVYNHNDADVGHDNFVDIAAGSVAGVLPTPARILMRNTTGVSYSPTDIYIGHNVQSAPNSFNPVLEAENSGAGGANVAFGEASNGFYRAVSWAGSAAVWAYWWTLSAAQLAQAAGNYFRVLARFASGPIFNLSARLSLRYPPDSPLTALYEGDEVR